MNVLCHPTTRITHERVRGTPDRALGLRSAYRARETPPCDRPGLVLIEMKCRKRYFRNFKSGSWIRKNDVRGLAVDDRFPRSIVRASKDARGMGSDADRQMRGLFWEWRALRNSA